MTDRELLEAAARAAGISLKGWTATAVYGNGFGAMLTTEGIGDRTWWNALTDDGDALRLSVRLSMTIVIDCEDKTALAVWYTGKLAKERFTDQASALVATRRAIVRCAAEAEKVIGRAALGETKREG